MKLKTFLSLSLTAFVGLSASLVHAQTFSVIHTFTGTGGDGAGPLAGVTLRGGALFGTTWYGGYGFGTVYQMTHAGSNWTTVPIYIFPNRTGPGGTMPDARVVFGPDSHLYGPAAGGINNAGVVFDLVPPVSFCKTVKCFWTENVLYSFSGSPDAGGPGEGDLIWDQHGNMYGTTAGGGTYSNGTVYEMTKVGSNWTETPIHSFSGPEGGQPFSGVTFDHKGNLFGTTTSGGFFGYGTIYKLSQVSNQWQATKIYDFVNSEGPNNAGLVVDSAGNLYGATQDGGTGGGGEIFELTANSYAFKVLYNFAGPLYSGCGPNRNLTLDSSGNLYGATSCDGAYQKGNVFKLTKTGESWVYTSLYDFTGGDDGAVPISSVTIDADGTLYGTTSAGGGSNGRGTVWRIMP